MREGFILKYIKGKGFFCKMAKRGRDSLGIRGKGRGLWAKLPFIPFLSTRKQGRGARESAAANPAVLGHDGGRERGGKGQGGAGV